MHYILIPVPNPYQATPNKIRTFASEKNDSICPGKKW